MTRASLVLRALLVQAALFGCSGTGDGGAGRDRLLADDIVIRDLANSSIRAGFAPDIALGGQALAVVGAAAPGDCASLCRSYQDGSNNSSCAWFNHCAYQGGCPGAGRDGSALGYQECLLMADANCSLVPTVVLTDDAHGHVVAGFPIRASQPTSLPTFAVRPARGLVGGDFDCGSSMLPGKCAFPVSPYAAAAACFAREECRSIVVYTNGSDGCGSGMVMVLKNTELAPDNEFVAPTVYTLERIEGGSTGGFILAAEATVVDALPAGSTNASSATTIPTPDGGRICWLGYLVSSVPAVANGDVVALLSAVATPEACARECQARNPTCNVFNYCPSGNCSYDDEVTKVALTMQQCELRFQEWATPGMGEPPFMLAKGEAAGGFVAGSPLQVWGPEAPGYRRHLGNGFFGQQGYACLDSILHEIQECVLNDPLEQVLERCSADPLCRAINYKPQLQVLGLNTNTSFLRRAEGANLSRMIATPTAVVYSKEDAATTSVIDSGSSGLPAGALAGIVAACVLAAAAAAVGGWVAVRRRGRRKGSGAQAADLTSTADAKAMEEGGSSPKPLLPSMPAGSIISSTRAVFPQDSVDSSGTLGLPDTASSRTQLTSVSSLSSHTSSASHAAPLLAAVAHLSLDRPSIASPFVAARLSHLSSWGSQQHSPVPADGISAGAMGSGAAVILGSTVVLPVAPITAAAEDAALPGSMVKDHRGSQPEPLALEANSEEVKELMAGLRQQRAQEEQTAALFAAPSNSPDTVTVASGGTSSRSSALEVSGTLALPPSLQAWLIPPSAIEYQLRSNGQLAVIGEGASGRVIRAVYNGEVVAAKEVDIGRGVEVHEAFLSEAQRMQALRHAHLVTFMGMAVNGNKGILVMELCEGQDLSSALRLKDATGQRLFGWYRHGCRVAYEVACALNYLHSKSVVHMDIKSSNVLLSSTGQAKVSDVGVSRHIERTYLSDLPVVVGTFAWVAPEILMGGHNCTRAVDLYSLSVVLWEIITGERPVRGHMRQPQVPEECPQEAVDLMEACASLDPSERPTAQQVMSRLRAMRLAQQQRQPSQQHHM